VAAPDTVLGAFIRDLEARIAEEEAAAGAAPGGDQADPDADSSADGDDEHADSAAGGRGRRRKAPLPVAGDGTADELRDALRLGRLLLSGVEVTL